MKPETWLPAKASATAPGSFQLFTEGDSLYADMQAAIAAAQQHVLLESYIFADDEVGRQFADCLITQARRGINVCLHLDAAGSLFWHSRRLSTRLRRNGVQLRWFHHWDWRHPWRYNRRNHRKLLVVDSDCAYVGGFNIHRENSRAIYGEQRWRDTHIKLQGPLVREARQLFNRFWRGHKRRILLPSDKTGGLLLSNYTRGSRRQLNGSIYTMLLHAQRSIYITTPYFVPGRHIQHLLAEAARRGVDVRLLVPEKSDVQLARWAARAAYDGLLTSGVKVYEYLPRLLHAKSIVVDSNYVTVGTANMDYRSFFLNYELNLFTRNPPLCELLQQVFFEDLLDSEEIEGKHWSRRPLINRLFELVGWLARRWL